MDQHNRPTTRSRVRSPLLLLSMAAALSGCADDPVSSSPRSPDAASSTPQAGDARVGVQVDADRDTGPSPTDAGPDDAGAPATTDAASSDAGEGGAGGRNSLIVHDLWKPTPAADDPFDDRPTDPTCPSTGVMTELLADERVFSVDTGACHYLTVTQPSQRAVAAGEILKVRLWHFALTAPMPAEAHASVVIDGVPLLDERVTIPGVGGLLSKEVRATRDIPAGAPVYFHLHNHGDNSWSLVEVSAGD